MDMETGNHRLQRSNRARNEPYSCFSDLQVAFYTWAANDNSIFALSSCFFAFSFKVGSLSVVIMSYKSLAVGTGECCRWLLPVKVDFIRCSESCQIIDLCVVCL